MDELKIAVIGGGSTYTPELVEGLLSGVVPVREIVLMDVDDLRLELVGGLAARMAQVAKVPVRITLTTEHARALDGADAVITQIRVGGMAARHLDERIPLRYGVVGHETTGPGGFAKALRTIPVLLELDREMAVRCPDAWLINFTNPSGLVTEALRLHGQGGHFVGLCNYPLTLKMKVAEALRVDEATVELAYFGLNHLSWARVLVDGVDLTDDLLEIMITEPAWRDLTGYAFDPDYLRNVGMLPSGYLRYYVDTERMVQELHAAPKTRAERVQEVEERLLAQYADPRLTTKPPELQERGGAWYSTAAVRLLRDLWSDTGGVHILNVSNQGALAMLPPDVVVETPAHVRRGGITTLPTVEYLDTRPRVAGYPVPPAVEELIRRVKAYELQAVAAAVTGDRTAAADALRLHPLLDGHHKDIPRLLDDLLNAHRNHLPQFFPDAS